MPTLKTNRPKKEVTFHRQEGKGVNFDKKLIMNLLDRLLGIFKSKKDPCRKGHKYISTEHGPYYILLHCEQCGDVIKRSIR